MRFSTKFMLCSAMLFQSGLSFGDVETKPIQTETKSNFQPFTGKICKNKVRLRLQPNLESPIIRELKKDTLMLVVGEGHGFYAVEPPSDCKAFVYRPYVLDGAIVGDRINIRVEPHLQAPILGQMNTGDKVSGKISAIDNKWLEITPPAGTHFYVAIENMERVGDRNYLTSFEKRNDEVKSLLESTDQTRLAEMEKPFPEIHLDSLIANYNKIVRDYTDFPEQVKIAKDNLSTLEEQYLQKKLTFLESQVHNKTSAWTEQNFQMSAEMEAQKTRIKELEQQLKFKEDGTVTASNIASFSAGLSSKMTTWLQKEKTLYEEWLKDNSGRSPDEFYADQQKHAEHLEGVIEPYDRKIKNKPGDFLLVRSPNHATEGYLYSTRIDLENYIGKPVKILAIQRSNNSFAYPAWYVLAVE